MNMRIGKTNYLNATPFYNGLASENGVKFDFVEGAPSVLNELVRNGKIEVSLISSLEYSKSPEKYFVLPGLSISSREASQSVGLIWKGEIAELHGREIFFLRDSYSSVALLDILLKERYEITNTSLSPVNPEELEKIVAEGGPVMVIGDRALELRNQLENSPVHYYDLGTLWWEWLKMPFCFALWVVRKDFYEANKETVKQFAEALKKRVKENLSRISVSGEDTKDYLLNFDYGLDMDILQGLFLFYERAAKLGWTKRIKDLEFIQ